MSVARKLFLFSGKQWFSARFQPLLFCSKFSDANPLRHIEILKDFTGSTEKEIVKALSKGFDLELLSDDEMRQRINSLKLLPISCEKKIDFLKLLKHHHLTILNRLMVLEEYGFSPDEITVNALCKYLTIIKKPIPFLKSRKYLEEDTDVLENLLQYVPLSAHPISLPSSDEMSPTDIKTKVLEVYLFDVLKMDPTGAYKAKSFLNRLKHKSLRLLVRNIEVIEKDIGISRERLLRNPFLFYTHPDNSIELINRVKEIGGIDICQVLAAFPRILSYPYENTLKIKQYLKDFKISDPAIQRCLEIFTFNAESTLTKLRELEKDEYFSVFRGHPRVLHLVAYQNKVRKRMKLLHDIKLYYASLNLMSLDQKKFDRFCELGIERPTGLDLIYFLSSELQCDRVELKIKLKKHPYWVYVPAVRLNQNLRALRTRGFTNEEFIKYPHVLLYPPQAVLNELDALNDRGKLECCRGDDGSIHKNLILPLLCYFIEKNCNFTGQAVWSEEELSEGTHPPPVQQHWAYSEIPDESEHVL